MINNTEISFKQMVELAPVSIMYIDIKGKIKYVSPKCKEMLGYENDELLEKRFLSIVAKEYRRQILMDSIKVIEQKKLFTSRCELLRNDFLTILCEISSQVHLDETGRLLGVVATIQNIIENRPAWKALRESERKYRTLVSQAADGIVIVQYEIIKFVNKSLCKILGYGEQEILGRNFFDFVLASDAPPIREIHAKRMAGRNVPIRHEMVMVKKNNEEISIEFNSCSIEYNSQTAALVFIRDISERKQVEVKINKYVAELKELNATKDRFFSIIAHDLRNPFHNIIGISEMLCNRFDKLETVKIKKFLEYIYQISEQGYSLLENLLEWAKSQRGRLKFNQKNINLKVIVTLNFDILRSVAKIKQIELIDNVSENVVCLADADMVSTVLRNLISNSLKFTEPGGRISISAYEVIENDVNKIVVAVKDTGVGIKIENVKKLFRIDSSYSTAGTAQERGTGLGLILCKEFVEKNSGRIWVDSKLGEGSTFSFTLLKAKLDANQTGYPELS